MSRLSRSAQSPGSLTLKNHPQLWSKGCRVADFKDRERELQAKEGGWSLELKIARKLPFPLEAPERNTARPMS